MLPRPLQRVHIIDSHTAGEPTRVVLDGGPDLGAGTLAARREVFHRHHDHFRSAVVHEPRGSDVLVGALLCPPSDPECSLGVLFFNNVGCLGMCGHGTIGLLKTLAHAGRIERGEHRIETPVGSVRAVLHDDGSVSVANVPSFCKARQVVLEVPGLGLVHGDVAWGGNWFFLTELPHLPLERSHVAQLTDHAWSIRQAVNRQGFPEVDHVELCGAAHAASAHARNFVLCPGKAYDRSPCGTGTSARLACLAIDGQLEENTPWVQEGILGSTFTGSYQWLDRAAGIIAPTISGTAYIIAEATLLLDENDPFCWGIPHEDPLKS